MKRILSAVALLCLLATPSFAAKVYLKEGGHIEAKKVWRTPGKVHVLVNRDTLTEFSYAEIDLKRTFGGQKRAAARRPAAAAKQVTPPEGGAVERKPDQKSGLALPSLPNLPAKGISSPDVKDDGAIRRHKKEMMERLNE